MVPPDRMPRPVRSEDHLTMTYDVALLPGDGIQAMTRQRVAGKDCASPRAMSLAVADGPIRLGDTHDSHRQGALPIHRPLTPEVSPCATFAATLSTT